MANFNPLKAVLERSQAGVYGELMLYQIQIIFHRLKSIFLINSLNNKDQKLLITNSYSIMLPVVLFYKSHYMKKQIALCK